MNTKLKTILGIAALSTLPLLLWSADDTDRTVRVITKFKVRRVAIEYGETNNLVSVTDRMFVLRYEDGAFVGEQQIDSTTRTRDELVAAGRTVFVNALENHPLWSKNNWPVTPP